MPRWANICQDCWEEEFPDEYFPEAIDMDDCSVCGAFWMVAHINPRRLEEQAYTDEPVVDRFILDPEV